MAVSPGSTLINHHLRSRIDEGHGGGARTDELTLGQRQVGHIAIGRRDDGRAGQRKLGLGYGRPRSADIGIVLALSASRHAQPIDFGASRSHIERR